MRKETRSVDERGGNKKILTFTGWVQREDALDAHAKALGAEAVHMEYQNYASEDDAFKAFGRVEAEFAIGWSLGGMVLMRAVANGVIKANKLILLASSYSFTGEYGVKEAEYAAFKAAFKRDAENTVLEFQKRISNPPLGYNIGSYAGYWLDRLGVDVQQSRHSGESRNPEDDATNVWIPAFAGMTILLGENDKTTPPTQKQLWLQHYPAAEIHVLPNVGHIIPAEALCTILTR